MAGPRLVIDTNVVVSGLLTSDDEAPTRLLLDRMLAGRCRFLLSPDLLAEYRLVLLRPKITALHRLAENEIDEVLVRLASNAMVVEPVVDGPDAADETDAHARLAGDGHLLAILTAAPDSILVTGDLALLRRAGKRAVRPRDAVAP